MLEYCSAMKKNEVLILDTTWMNLENMLSERSHYKKGHILYNPIYMKYPGYIDP